MTCCVDDNKLNNCISISLPICILLFLIWINFHAAPPRIAHNDIEIDKMHTNSSNPPSLSPIQMIGTSNNNNIDINDIVDNINNNTFDNTNSSTCIHNKCKLNMDIQQQLDTMINYDIPQILLTNQLNDFFPKAIKKRNGFDLLKLFQNKRVLFHGDSIMSLFYELLMQCLYYCTPLSLNISISNISYIRQYHTKESFHPCGKQFCDFIWSENIYNLFIMDSTLNTFQQCMMTKMGGGWNKQQSVDFMKHITQTKNIKCQTYIDKIKNIELNYCDDYIKYDKIDQETHINNIFVKNGYDIIIDEMGLMHIFQNIPNRNFEQNAVKKMYLIKSIIYAKMKHHSFYNNYNNNKCYIFMSFDPICEQIINPLDVKKEKYEKQSKIQLKWKLIQEKLGLNKTNYDYNYYGKYGIKQFNVSLLNNLNQEQLNMIDQCVKNTKNDFNELGANISDNQIKEYCITHAWTDYSGLLISSQIRDLVLSMSQTKEFCANNIYFYDQYKLFHQFTDQCDMKHRVGPVHLAGYYPLQLITLLNLIDFAQCE